MKSYLGKVTSTKMQKTIVVEVTRLWMHPKYQKKVKRTKKYLVHDEKSLAGLGDTVQFNESVPISKLKRFRLDKIVEKAAQSETDIKSKVKAE